MLVLNCVLFFKLFVFAFPQGHVKVLFVMLFSCYFKNQWTRSLFPTNYWVQIFYGPIPRTAKKAIYEGPNISKIGKWKSTTVLVFYYCCCVVFFLSTLLLCSPSPHSMWLFLSSNSCILCLGCALPSWQCNLINEYHWT